MKPAKVTTALETTAPAAMRNPFAAVAICVMMAVLLTVVSGCGGGDKATENETLTIARSQPIGTLDPAMMVSPEDESLAFLLYERLTELVMDDNIVVVRPALAASWSYRPDGRVWDFTLAEGHKFSDGSDVTADSVVFSIQRAMSSGMPAAHWLRNVDSVVATEAGGVQFRLLKAEPSLAERLALPAFSVLNVAVKENVAKVGWLDSHSAGSGPYVIAKKSEQLTLTVNEHSKRPPMQFEEVSVVSLGDSAAQLAAIRDGKADVSASITPQAAANIALGGPVRVSWYEAAGELLHVAVNLRLPELQAAELRQALRYAVNYKTLPESLSGYAESVGGYLPPLTTNFTQARAIAVQNMPKAKSLIASMTVPPLTLVYLADDKKLAPVAGSLKRDWERLGLEITVLAASQDEYAQQLSNGTFQLLLNSVSAKFPDASSIFAPLFGDPTMGGVLNYAGYSSDSIGAMLFRAAASRDPENRPLLFQTAEREILKVLPVIPLLAPHKPVVMNNNIRLLNFNPLNTAALPADRMVRE